MHRSKLSSRSASPEMSALNEQIVNLIAKAHSSGMNGIEIHTVLLHAYTSSLMCSSSPKEQFELDKINMADFMEEMSEKVLPSNG